MAMADEAKDAYKAGQDLLKEHKTLAAVRSFEKAVSLKPETSRYRDALAKARDLALGEALQHAPQFAASDFTALLKLHEICLQLDSKDPRTLEVEKIVLRTRASIEAKIAQAKDKAIGGDLPGASSLLEPLHRYKGQFASMAGADIEISFRGHLQLARKSVEQGNYKLALEAAQKALDLRPEHPDAIAVQASVAEDIVPKLKPIIAEKAASGHLSDLGFAVYAVDETERACPPCRGRIADVAKLRAEYQRGTLALLSEMSKTKSRPAGWAACGAVAEARLSFEADRKYALDAYCTASARTALRVGLAIRVPDRCSTEGLKSRIEAGLPAGSVVVPVTIASGASPQDFDLALSINIDRCVTQSLGETGVRTQTSSYVAGTQQLANPEYAQIESQLRSAQIEQTRLQQASQANPNDFAASIGLAAVAIRVGTLSGRLRKTNPYIDTPVEVPYKYEVFQAGVAGVMEGTLDFIDPADPRLSSSLPLRALHEVWAPGVRGVYPRDTHGLTNQEPNLPGPEALELEALKELDAQIAKGVSEVLPVWLAAKASSALSSRKPFDALGYLTLLRITKVPASDPDLSKFKDQQLSSLLLSLPEIEAQRLMLGVFETRLQRTAEAKVSAGGSGKLQFLETALKSVVMVRRGDIEGTGFLVSPSGLIVTNYHVVEASGKIEVETSEGEVFLASVVNQSPDKDLALLQIPASKLPYLQLASAEEADIGEDVYALGNPRGLQGTVTKGIISAKRRLSGIRLVQIDAPINPGNSGGPLLLSNGRVVGVNTLKMRDSEGLNFAISIDEAKAAFPAILVR